MIDPLEIQALADGELSKERAAELRAEIAKCQRSTAEFLYIQSLTVTVREKCPQSMDRELWTRCVHRLDEIDKTRRVTGMVDRYAWTLSTAFVMLIAVGAGYSRMHSNGLRPADVSRASAGFSSLGRSNEQSPAVVQRWLADVGHVPTGLSSSLPILGSAEGTLDGKRVLRVILRDSDRNLALYIFPGGQAFEGLADADGYRSGQIGDLNCVQWDAQGASLLLVGDREVSRLGNVAQNVSLR
ncbi:MAG: hypothetical protein JSS72_00935 [Armatimonadetes bacterium]|nr:hypothetical protein [Armatimonadota bacterium]